MRLFMVLLLLASPVAGQTMQGATLVGTATRVSSACNQFTETTWDNLNDFTQDSSNLFTADSTNDELDHGSLQSDSQYWIIHNTDTTDEDHCVMWKVATFGSGVHLYNLALRVPTGSTDFYTVGYFYLDSNIYWARTTKTASGSTWQEDIDVTPGAQPDSGDYISACVDGTGNDTVVTYWDHGASDPGDCRSDWGTATHTFTGDPSTAVNSNTRVGLQFEQWTGSSGVGAWDEFVGSDY